MNRINRKKNTICVQGFTIDRKNLVADNSLIGGLFFLFRFFHRLNDFIGYSSDLILPGGRRKFRENKANRMKHHNHFFAFWCCLCMCCNLFCQSFNLFVHHFALLPSKAHAYCAAQDRERAPQVINMPL